MNIRFLNPAAKYLLVLLFLFPIGMQAQLLGRYYFWSGDFSESIIFKPNHAFEYDWSVYERAERGAGTYQYQDDMMILNFGIDPDSLLDPSFDVRQTPIRGDMRSVSIQVFDASRTEPLEYVTVTLRNRTTILAGDYTDDNGKCQFNVSANWDSLRVQIDFVGNRLFYSLREQANYEIAAYLNQEKVTNLKPGEQKVFYVTQKPTESKIYLSKHKGEPGIPFELDRSWRPK
jgi:hypothetical protein